MFSAVADCRNFESAERKVLADFDTALRGAFIKSQLTYASSFNNLANIIQNTRPRANEPYDILDLVIKFLSQPRTSSWRVLVFHCARTEPRRTRVRCRKLSSPLARGELIPVSSFASPLRWNAID